MRQLVVRRTRLLRDSEVRHWYNKLERRSMVTADHYLGRPRSTLTVLFTLIPYLFSCLATLKLIAKANRKTHVLHSRWTPVLAVIFSVALFYYIGIMTLLLGLLFMMAGVAFYLIFLKRRTRNSSRGLIGPSITPMSRTAIAKLPWFILLTLQPIQNASIECQDKLNESY